MLSINCVDFDTVRIKTRSEASMKLQEIIRQKKKRMLYSKNHKFGMNSCRSNLSTLTQYEDNPVQITEREEQRESGTFFTFNDAFDLIKRTRKQKILTEGNESKVGIRETVLRPQLFRIIAKIKNKQERKKIKQNSSQIYRKPK